MPGLLIRFSRRPNLRLCDIRYFSKIRWNLLLSVLFNNEPSAARRANTLSTIRRQEATKAATSAADLDQKLKATHFPATKEDVEEQARKNGASGEVMEAIRAMPDSEFGSITDVERAFGQSSGKSGDGGPRGGEDTQAAQKG